ncbi:hypothetical protein [Rhizohabitans arisaemae]|uniref:hypothetical protein n=1 Tax=Rhizohabitans arisaemae TaxID=2720610 RepID=UPI0024B1ED73|nr:hypothetical protein [Rhizohabitans arisaemae]
MPDRAGLLVLMGSGETSPTMVTVHRAIARRLGDAPRAVLLDTPYAFQENAALISARARRYFAGSVGLHVEVAREPHQVKEADWVFSGPGSPTFALRRWTGGPVGRELAGRVRAGGGATVLASAAACTAGVSVVPVYEVYKVGAEPHWLDGLNLLGRLGLKVAVIPHYDNAEGGTHDTRFCYLGERRLARMESLLPEGAGVLGVDEHTAVVLDVNAGDAEVVGRGGVTVRLRGAQLVLPAGTFVSLAELTGFFAGEGLAGPPPARVPGGEPARTALGEVIQACERRFDAAAGERRAQAVLDLEEEITRWAADTEEDEGGVAQARAVLRHLVVRLARAAESGDQRDRLAPMVEPLLTVRADLRRRELYHSADAIRAALAAVGIHVQDGPDGVRWSSR